MKSKKQNRNDRAKKPSNISMIKRFLPYYKKYTSVLLFDLLCAAMTTLCELVLPLLVRTITNTATQDIKLLTVELILRCGTIYFVLKAIDTAAYYYMSSVGHIMGTKMETDMRRDFFAHLQKLSFTYYDNTKIGTIMSRITSDMFDITEFAHHCPEEFFIAGIKIISSFIILCTMNIPLTIIVFALIPVMICTLAPFRTKMKESFRDSRKQVGELNARVEDSLLGIHEVKAFSNEDIEEHKFEEGNARYLDIKKVVYKQMGAFHSITRCFDGLLYITVVVAGAFFMRAGKINAADFIAYLLYVTMLLNSVKRIVEFTEQFQRGMTGIERFSEIMDIEPDITDKPGAVEITDIDGNIDFENVTFRYSADSPNVLTNLSLHIYAGENLAIVGPSGGGKTTFCSLLPRFYELDGGRILIDGKDITDIKLSSLREKIGIVQQNIYLFSGTIRDNIEYGKPGASFEEIKEAARLAGADEFISSLANGYDTYVGERGLKLSGGQKQRISIARVFLKNPPILILDEATSALDNESERLVQQSLEKLAKGRTTITIAHRLTTIRNADKIIVLTPDGIAEEGSHEELMSKNGMYADMYNLYTAD